MATVLTVGTEITAYCAKCVSVQPHVIVAMKGTRASRTECKTCGSVHAYRKNPPGTKRPPRLSEYEKATDGRDLSRPIAYKLTGKFKQHDVLKHKTFGVGLVVRLVTDQKMEVIFPDNTKVLVYSR